MEACLYEKGPDQEVRCLLCAHQCRIKPDRRGLCGVRQNNAGVLNTLVYGRLIAQHVDPIEKKPIFHLLPGSRAYSIATVGCNFKCRFCQNADIAQMPADHQGSIIGMACSPEAVVKAALNQNCKSIAYTYTEPTIFFEFAFETARLAHAQGLKNVFVTNGYMSGQALEMVAPYLDAANVDLKAYTDDFYRSYCSARLAPVKETLQGMKRLGVLVEVTTLIIPGLNDSASELAELAAYLVQALGPETPWHISRFHPTYRMTDRIPTPVRSLTMAREIGLKAGLRYVYIGNVPGEGGESTYCHHCGTLLIERLGFTVRRNMIDKDRCPRCGNVVYGVAMGGS